MFFTNGRGISRSSGNNQKSARKNDEVKKQQEKRSANLQSRIDQKKKAGLEKRGLMRPGFEGKFGGKVINPDVDF